MSNPAFEAGRAKFNWWPDWQEECVAIVGAGPSLKSKDLSILKNRIHIIAIKTAIDLCPWAEICYGCDAAWWNDRKGLPKFGGLKIFHGIQANQWSGLHRVEIDLSKDQMLVDQPLKIGNGGNSGFQALNLAIQFGATNVPLIGLDMGAVNGESHWYGRNKWQGANNPMQSNFNRWKQGFKAAKESIDKLGVEIVNCSMESTMKTFPKVPLEQVLEDWGL
jgi:hypothetical protein